MEPPNKVTWSRDYVGFTVPSCDNFVTGHLTITTTEFQHLDTDQFYSTESAPRIVGNRLKPPNKLTWSRDYVGFTVPRCDNFVTGHLTTTEFQHLATDQFYSTESSPSVVRNRLEPTNKVTWSRDYVGFTVPSCDNFVTGHLTITTTEFQHLDTDQFYSTESAPRIVGNRLKPSNNVTWVT